DEASALRRIAAHQFTSLATPELIALHDWRGLQLLVMSALPASPWRRSAPARRRPPAAAMDELALAFGTGAHGVVEAPWWRRCEVACDSLVDTVAATRFRAALQVFEARWGADLAVIGAWHGDFTPWNMAHARG